MEHEKYPLVKDEQLVFRMVCVSNFITSVSSFILCVRYFKRFLCEKEEISWVSSRTHILITDSVLR